MHRQTLRSAVSALALAAFGAPAAAGDVPALWTGIYAGANIGYGLGSADYTHRNANLFGAPGNAYSHDLDGVVGGVQVGYDYQISNIVVGIEASLSYGVHGDALVSGVDTDTDLSGFGAITGRVGYAHEKWLGYAKGGAAWADVEPTLSTPSRAWSKGDALTGWVAGFGVERMIVEGFNGQAISVGLEYLHYEFDANLFEGPDNLKPVGSLTQVDGDLSFDTIIAKAALRF